VTGLLAVGLPLAGKLHERCTAEVSPTRELPRHY